MSPLADDLLSGAEEIAQYVFKRADPKARRKVYHKFQMNLWPIWKDGTELVSRKSLLDAHFNPPTKIEAADVRQSSRSGVAARLRDISDVADRGH